MFADNRTLWTPTLLDELDRLFVQNYDEGEGNFYQKLKGQLQPGSVESRRLITEALWILMLFQSNASPEHKNVPSTLTLQPTQALKRDLSGTYNKAISAH